MFGKLFTTEGRLNRLPYAKYYFGLLLASFFAIFILSVIFVLGGGSTESISLQILSFIVTLPFTVATVMVSIRRLHDLNRSGWLAVLQFIPIANVILGIYLLFFKGTYGPNEYGADPLGF